MEPDRIDTYIRVKNRLLKHFNTLRDNPYLRTSLYGPSRSSFQGYFDVMYLWIYSTAKFTHCGTVAD